MFARTAALLATALVFPAAPAPAGEPFARAAACLAEAVYFEARGTPDKARAAVAYVVLNRSESSKFPDSVCGVVRDGCQFSYQCDGRPEALTNVRDRAEAYETASAVLEGTMPDPTGGALFYHNDGVHPSWSHAFHKTATIGRHVFYR